MPRVSTRNARRPVRRRWRLGGPALVRRLALGGVLVAAVGALAGAGAWLWRDGVFLHTLDLAEDTRIAALRWTARSGLAVDEILLEGRRDTRAEHVLAAIDTRRGAPILAFSPSAAKLELERLPWVRRAEVERRLPGTIRVRLVEREALALWQRQGRLALIDTDGGEIRGGEIARYAHLPVVVGEDAPRHAALLLGVLAAEPELEKRVTHAIRVAGRRWNLRLDNGVEVQLPEDDAGAAWARLAETERASGVIDRALVAIDLRLPGRLVLRAIPEPPPPLPAARARGAQRPT